VTQVTLKGYQHVDRYVNALYRPLLCFHKAILSILFLKIDISKSSNVRCWVLVIKLTSMVQIANLTDNMVTKFESNLDHWSIYKYQNFNTRLFLVVAKYRMVLKVHKYNVERNWILQAKDNIYMQP
jgi:hypothetical protein